MPLGSISQYHKFDKVILIPIYIMIAIIKLIIKFMYNHYKFNYILIF